MAACEKCWSDAYMRSRWNGKSQSDNYQDLLQERRTNPCSKEQQMSTESDDNTRRRNDDWI
jgi:hypothetical protein